MPENSILDAILTRRHAEDLRLFNPVTATKRLLSQLSEREHEVVSRRFGLPFGSNTETLEEIGVRLHVTRERVRQITKSAVKKITQFADKDQELKSFVSTVEQLLRSYGGAMEDQYFIERLFDFMDIEQDEQKRNAARVCLVFILDEALSTYIDHRRAQNGLRDMYVVPGTSLKIVEGVVAQFERLIVEHNEPVPSDILLKKFHNTEYYQAHGYALVQEAVRVAREFTNNNSASDAPTVEEESRVLLAYLRASAKLNKNIFGEWGIETWSTITPKRMNEKIYLILRREGQPLHFKTISEKVNAANFDKKVAKPPSVHNELILDKRFVLVGRGTYALVEWGYKPGTVSEVIANLLTSRGPLTREEIVAGVLDKRVVKKQTIHLALLNHEVFAREANGKYILVGTPPTS